MITPSVPIDPAGFQERLKNQDTRRQALVELAEWVRLSCLFAGSQATTAYKVAAAFVGGLERHYEDLVRVSLTTPSHPRGSKPRGRHRMDFINNGAHAMLIVQERLVGIPIQDEASRLQTIAMDAHTEWLADGTNIAKQLAYGQALLAWGRVVEKADAITQAERLIDAAQRGEAITRVAPTPNKRTVKMGGIVKVAGYRWQHDELRRRAGEWVKVEQPSNEFQQRIRIENMDGLFICNAIRGERT